MSDKVLTTSKIVKTGWGVKQGSKVKSWKRRWFVLLSNGILRYFEDKISYVEKGRYELNKQTTFSVSCASSEGFPIAIVNKQRTLNINFQTRDEADDWVRVLTDVKNVLK